MFYHIGHSKTSEMNAFAAINSLSADDLEVEKVKEGKKSTLRSNKREMNAKKREREKSEANGNKKNNPKIIL